MEECADFTSLLLTAHSGFGTFFGLILLLAAHSGSHISQGSVGDQPGGEGHTEPLGQGEFCAQPHQPTAPSTLDPLGADPAALLDTGSSSWCHWD